MRFWRKKHPSGGEVSPEFAAGMQAMEEWYQEFVVWAYAYISLLEKRLQERNEDRCSKGESGEDQCDSV